MTHPILTVGEIISIDNNAYQVMVGLKKGAAVGDEPVYNVHLRACRYDPNHHVSDYYCKNIEVPIFERL